MTALTLPECLDPTRETHRALQKAMTDVAKKPSLRAASWIFDVQRLGVCLHALGRDDDALTVSRWLGDRVTFEGNHDRWLPAGFARCLTARLLRARGDEAGAAEALRPIVAVPLYAPWTPDDVRTRQAGLADDARALDGARDARVPRLQLQWAIAGLLHLRETASFDVPYAPLVDRAACDAALSAALSTLARWLSAKG